ncbi:MAG: SAM-dependent methyltransferase [Candidatus Endobugula sp.]|jgi:SAM-dependent methyltransferase
MNIQDIRQEIALLTDVTPLEGTHYAACLHTYESASNQRKLILSWFAKHVIPQFSKDSTSLLSVGCGAGDLDVNILAAGKAHTSTISYVGLEPDPQQCERFVDRMGLGNDNSIHIEGHNTSFEDFSGDLRFDLVMMVHSLYYMDNPEQAIDDALNLVSEGGRLVILIASNDTLNELSSSFWAVDSSGPTWFSEDLSKHLHNHSIAFDCQRIEATLDITSCCKPDSQADIEKGNRIADFLAQVPTAELPHRLRQMIFSYLGATSQRDGDMLWLSHNVDAFTIPAR